MKVLKKILFTLMSVFLIYRSYDMIGHLILNPAENSTSESLVLALLINLFITGIFAFPGFVYQTSKIFPSKYYLVHNEKQLSIVYKILKVDVFRKALLFLFWGHKKNSKKYFDGTRTGLDNFIYQSKQSEFGHLNAFVLITLISIILLFKEYYLIVVFTIFINAIGNLYPVILQRYHRFRIQKIAARRL
jgi:hypothetical protein